MQCRDWVDKCTIFGWVKEAEGEGGKVVADKGLERSSEGKYNCFTDKDKREERESLIVMIMWSMLVDEWVII